MLTDDAPWIHREGVLAHQASATDLLFITLRKSEALFSPSTRYRDLALGPSLFHWESQSTTTAASPTGQRTIIHHAACGSRVLLYRCAEACGYVREQRKQDGRRGGLRIGHAPYKSRVGQRPMASGESLWQVRGFCCSRASTDSNTSQVGPAQDDPITTNSCSATRRRHGRTPAASGGRRWPPAPAMAPHRDGGTPPGAPG